MNDFLVGASIGVGVILVTSRLNAECWSSGGSLNSNASSNPICTSTQSMVLPIAIAGTGAYLTGGLTGLLGAGVGGCAVVLFALGKAL